MVKSIVILIYLSCFKSEKHLLGELDPKNQNCLKCAKVSDVHKMKQVQKEVDS